MNLGKSTSNISPTFISLANTSFSLCSCCIPTGIQILYAKQKPETPGFFLFLAPLSNDVWINLCTAFLFTALSVYVVSKYVCFTLKLVQWDPFHTFISIYSRITMRDWINPHPVSEHFSKFYSVNSNEIFR